MTHDERFAEFRARRERERQAVVKVTWRKVSPLTGGGWSGIGSQGTSALVFVSEARQATKADLNGMRGWAFATVYDYGRIVDGERIVAGCSMVLSKAKANAAKLLGGRA